MLIPILLKAELWQTHTLTFKSINPSSIPDFGLKLVAFASLPLIFQFVDMSNWQRMASIAIDPNTASGSLLKRTKSGLAQYLTESPLSWVLPVVLGMCATQVVSTSGDSWDAFVAYVLGRSGGFGAFLSVVMICGVTAIFLSTADSLVGCLGYTYAYDVSREASRAMDRAALAGGVISGQTTRRVVNIGRRAMSLALGIIIVSFILTDIVSQFGATLLGLFLAFFAPMAAFAPAVIIPAITKRCAPTLFAWVAIGIGSAVGIIVGVISVFKGGAWQWWSIILPSCVSWLAYLTGWSWNAFTNQGRLGEVAGSLPKQH